MESDSARIPLLDKPSTNADNTQSKHQIIPEPFYITYLCCCCSDKQNNLTTTEYTSFQTLLSQCLVPFNTTDTEHQNKLSTLFTLAQPQLIKHKPQFQQEEQGTLWKEFGFQTNIPSNDFRGGGLKSLECMIHFSKNYPNELGEMFNTEFFSFAIIMIKMCFKIRTVFRLFNVDDLNKQIQIQNNEEDLCNRKELKRFCKALSDDNEFFYKVVNMGMLITWKMYVQRIDVNKGELNILKIDVIVNEVVNVIKEVFDNESDCERIQEALVKKYNDINIHK
jgi:hypothetical protein